MMKIIQQYNIKKKFSCRKNLEKVSKFFLVTFLFVGVINIQYTNAYFSDTDTSSDNNISAGILDIALDNSSVYSSGLLYPTDSTTTSSTLSNTGTLDSQYTVETTITGNVNSVCDYVTMTATSPTSAPYSGPIEDFTSLTTETINTTWDFNFTIASDAPPSVWGKTCYFKWIYTAWQDNLPNASSGFSSIKEKKGAVKIGKVVVLNEFIPDPDGLDNALMPGGEWVELYNNSNISIDLSGWALYDNDDSHELYITDSNTNTSGTIIGAHGFLVVYKNGDADFILNNDTDTVRLATGYPIASNIVVDSYLYDGEKPEGYSWARLPADGTGDWVDPIPTPGISNTLVEEEITLEIDTAGTNIEEKVEPLVEITKTPIIKEEEIEGEIKNEEIIATEELIAQEPIAEEEVIEEVVLEEPIAMEETKEEVMIEKPIENVVEEEVEAVVEKPIEEAVEKVGEEII